MQTFEIEGLAYGFFNEKSNQPGASRQWHKKDLAVYQSEENEYGDKRESYTYITFWNDRIETALKSVRPYDKVRVKFFLNGKEPRDWNGGKIASNELRGIAVTIVTPREQLFPQKFPSLAGQTQPAPAPQPAVTAAPPQGNTVIKAELAGKQRMDAAVMMVADTLNMETVSNPAPPQSDDENDLPF